MNTDRIRDWLANENVLAGIVFVITFSVYLTTMCPTVGFTDSGELATVAATEGIAHPTGYPLWTLLSRIAAMIPVDGQVIVHLNVFAAIVTALAVTAFFKFVLLLFRGERVFKRKLSTKSAGEGWTVRVVAFATALTFGFSSTVWSQSVEIEVYALHALLVVLTLYFFVSGIEQQLTSPEQISRHLLLFVFVLGLSFSNHMSTIFLAPGFLYLYFVSFGFKKKSWRLLGIFLPFFVLASSVYIYLPVRSADGPLMDWGHPVTLERFWWHVSGKQYQVWMFSSMDVIKKQLTYFFSNFPTEFQWPVLLIVIVGILEAYNRSRRFLVFTGLLFVTCVLYAANYDIHDVDSYFLLAYMTVGCVLAVGVLALVERISRWNFKYAIPATVLCLVALPVVQVGCNRSDVDQSKNFQVADFVRDAYAQFEPNAVVFASLWDYFISPSYYYQIVRNERPDLRIVDLELLKNRPWYFIQLKREYPDLLKGSEEKVNAFLTDLDKFEQGEPFDPRSIQSHWTSLLNDLVTRLLPGHAVYADPRLADEFPPDFQRMPQGLFIRLFDKNARVDWKPLTAVFSPGTFHNEVTSDLQRYFASMYTYHAYWLLTQNRVSGAEQYIQKALEVDAGFLPALNLKGQLLVGRR